MKCAACDKAFGHYCSSCDPEIPFDNGFCHDCWELTGANTIYNDYEKRIDSLYAEREEKLKCLAKAFRNAP